MSTFETTGFETTAGADVSFFASGSGSGSASASAGDPWENADAGRLMVEPLERLRAVTLAAIWGPCVGGGLVLAAGCDLRLAAEDTYFSIPEVEELSTKSSLTLHSTKRHVMAVLDSMTGTAQTGTTPTVWWRRCVTPSPGPQPSTI